MPVPAELFVLFYKEADRRDVVGGGFVWSKTSLLWAAVAGDGSRSSPEQNPREELAWDGEQGFASVQMSLSALFFQKSKIMPRRQSSGISSVTHI